MAHKAYKYETEVTAGGKVEVTVPLPAGCRVEVVILAEEDEFSDLRNAATLTMGFWDNPQDEAAWNKP